MQMSKDFCDMGLEPDSYLFSQFHISYDTCRILEITFGICGHVPEFSRKCFVRMEILENVSLDPAYLLKKLDDIITVYNTGNHCCPEFVRRQGHDNIDRIPDILENSFFSCSLQVFSRGAFNIHCHIVCKTENILQPAGVGSICVHLNGEACSGFYTLDKINYASVQKGFPTCYCYGFYEAFPLQQLFDDLLMCESEFFIEHIRSDKFRIMAVGTLQIAAGYKYYG